MTFNVEVKLTIRDGAGGPTVDVEWRVGPDRIRGSWVLSDLSSGVSIGGLHRPGTSRSDEELLLRFAIPSELTLAEVGYAQTLLRRLLAPTRQMDLLLRSETDPPRIALFVPDWRLQRLPWELLSVGNDNRPLCTSGGSLIRGSEGVTENHRWNGNPRVLIGGASPRLPGLGSLAEGERFVSSVARIVGGLRSGGEAIHVEHHWPLTPDHLNHRGDIDVVILVGHGIHAEDGRGIWLEDNSGDATRLDCSTLAAALKGVRLVILLSCHGANGTIAEASLAEALVKAGVGAVVAFDGLIDWGDAQTVTTALVRALATASDLEGAVALARRAVHSVTPTRLSWAQLRVFQRGAERSAVWSLHRANVPMVPDQISQRVRPESPSDGTSTGLVRRGSVEQLIQVQLRDSATNQVIVITGDPGDGKTSLLVSLIDGDRPAIDEVFGPAAVVHAHWCIRNDQGTVLAKTFVEGWSKTLADNIPKFAYALESANREWTNNSYQYWQQLVLEPLEKARSNGEKATVVLVVDALDEAITSPNAGATADSVVVLLRQVIDQLPPLTHVVCTTRVETPLEARHVNLLISLRDPAHADAVETWLSARIGAALEGVVEPGRIAAAQRDAVNRCSRSFLVAGSLVRAVLDEVEQWRQTRIEPVLDAAAWPDSLERAFSLDFGRIAGDKMARRLVGLISVAQDGGIPTTLLEILLFPKHAFAKAELRDVQRRIPYYLRQGRLEGTLQLFHEAFSAFVRDLETEANPADGTAPTREGPEAHKAISSLLSADRFSWSLANRYLVVAGPTHLASAALSLPSHASVELTERLAEICFDIEWIERRVVESGPTELLSDLYQAKELGVIGPPSRR